MRIVFAAVIALCSFLYSQMNIAVAQEAPAWLQGEYVAELHPPNRAPVTFYIQIKKGTNGADGRLTLDIQTRTESRPDWTPVQSYEAKLVSPERANIAFTTQGGSRFDLIAAPDGSLSGTASPSPNVVGHYKFTKRACIGSTNGGSNVDCVK
jgi:hypothetical protein